MAVSTLKLVVFDAKESEVRKVAATGSSSGSVDKEHSYVLANPPSPVMEISVEDEEVSVLGNTSGGETQFSQPKKANLSENLEE